MSDLLTAARQALPGLEWREFSYDGAPYVYGKGHGLEYGVFDLDDLDAVRADAIATRAALDAALGDSDRFNLAGLALLVERWPTCPHAEPYCETLTRGGDCTCGAAEADLARAEARRLLGVSNG